MKRWSSAVPGLYGKSYRDSKNSVTIKITPNFLGLFFYHHTQYLLFHSLCFTLHHRHMSRYLCLEEHALGSHRINTVRCEIKKWLFGYPMYPTWVTSLDRVCRDLEGRTTEDSRSCTEEDIGLVYSELHALTSECDTPSTCDIDGTPIFRESEEIEWCLSIWSLYKNGHF